MFNIFKNAFTKKNKHNSSFQMEDINQPPIQKSKTQDFQIIDEQAMNQIEQQYNEKQENKEIEDQLQQEQSEKNDEYMDYIVQEDDSLFGIALKFSVNEAIIMNINSLSSDLIFKGQVLKVPQTNQPRFSVIRLPDKSKEVENIWNHDQFSQKFEVIYCHSTQNTQGQLTLTSDIVLFDAHQQQQQQQQVYQQQQQQQQQQKSFKLNACISMRDINEAVYYVITNQYGQKDYIVQIFLSGIGKPNFEKKYHKQLKKFKQEKRSIATVFFRHAERNREGKLYTEETKKENCIFMARFISDACSDYQDQPQLTRLPYIDLIEDKQKKSDIKLEEISDLIGERMGKIWASLEYVPQLKESSVCFTNSSFKQLIEQVPPVYRLADWVKYYTIDDDGSSYQNMLLEIKFISPLIMILKDTDMKVYGSFISSELHQKSNGFQGSGETFLFQIHNNETKTYFWTEKNKDFVFCDETGLGIGCGDKFGLFIDQSLTFGYSNVCETFDNVRFSNEEKFRIKHLEVWAISQR